MALEGHDPRTWDLWQLCAAFEYQLRTGCKDVSEWQRERQKLYAPPKGVAVTRGSLARPKPPPMAAGDVSAFLASLAAEDKSFGAA